MTVTLQGATKQPYLPEVANTLAIAPGMAIWKSDEDIYEARKTVAAAFEGERNVILSDRAIAVEDKFIPSPNGDLPITVLSKAQPTVNALKPAILHLHGGGMVLGDRYLGLGFFTRFVKELDAVIVTVEYRLAPEHTGMTLVEDCYAALKWLGEHCEELRVDPRRLMIAGASAGGGLAAGTALLARDRGGPRLCGQMLLCPMVDDRNATVSASQFERERSAWCTAQNIKAWGCVLGNQAGKDGVSMYIAPARAIDLSGLPPAFVDVGGAEPFRDEAVAYAMALSRCGVLTDFHVWGGGCHNFELFAPEAVSTKVAAHVKEEWVRKTLQNPQ